MVSAGVCFGAKGSAKGILHFIATKFYVETL